MSNKNILGSKSAKPGLLLTPQGVKAGKHARSEFSQALQYTQHLIKFQETFINNGWQCNLLKIDDNTDVKRQSDLKNYDFLCISY